MFIFSMIVVILRNPVARQGLDDFMEGRARCAGGNDFHGVNTACVISCRALQHQKAFRKAIRIGGYPYYERAVNAIITSEVEDIEASSARSKI